MKKILVTGGCGFIGSNFIHYLFNKSIDVEVVNLDNLTYAAKIDNLIGIEPKFHKHVYGDICDKKIVKKLFKENKFDYLINFAAESHVDRSIDNPSQFIKTNIFGTYTLLEESLNYMRESENKDFRFYIYRLMKSMVRLVRMIYLQKRHHMTQAHLTLLQKQAQITL